MRPRTDTTLSREFWLGDVDARCLAAFRIAFGLVLLWQLADLWPDARAYLTNQGVAEAPVAWPFTLGVFTFVTTPAAVHGVLFAYALALLAFTAGLWTRASTVAAWLFKLSLLHRQTAICSGGDHLATLFLFLMIFARTAECWSLDARLRGHDRARVPAAPLRAMQILLAVLYWVTARLKHKGTWGSGEGVRLSLEILGFTRPLGAWMLNHPDLCRMATFLVLGLEYLYPFLVLSPIATRRAHLLALLVGTAVQGGVMATMRIGLFTPLMLVTGVLYVPTEVWDRIRPLRAERVDATPAPTSRWRALAGLWSSRTACSGAGCGSRRRFEALGRRSDGAQVDVVPLLAPGLGAVQAGWGFDHWTKLAFTAPTMNATLFARYFCGEYARRYAPARLDELTIVLHQRWQTKGGRPPAPERSRVLWQGACGAGASL